VKLGIISVSNIIRHLPEKQKKAEYFESNVISSQFSQGLSALDDVMYSSECVNIFKSFGIYDDEIFRTSTDRSLTSNRGLCEDDEQKIPTE
jgi:hypothetical protein